MSAVAYLGMVIWGGNGGGGDRGGGGEVCVVVEWRVVGLGG